MTREIQVLGDVRVCADGERIEEGASPRALMLLAALALAGGRPVDRAELAFQLWPESTDGQARTNLRKVLHELRAWLPDDGWIDIDQRRARLRTEEVTVDVEVVRSAAARGDDPAVAAAYAGPLLPGYWDDWVIEERRALEDQVVASLQRHLATTEDADERIQAAKRLLQLDRTDEIAHRALIRAHADAGNRSAALRAFHTCSTALERDLGVAPEDETVAVYEAVRRAYATTGRGPTPAVSASPRPQRTVAPLVGRKPELTWLERRWKDATADERVAALVTGESGIGKSRLVDELAARCERAGHVVLRSRAYESDGGRSLVPVMDWLRHDAVRQAIEDLAPGHVAELSRLLPEHATGAVEPSSRDPADARALLFDAADAALGATRAPLLLVLDDLQWCGQDTVDFVIHLLRRSRIGGLLVAMTRRDHERPADRAVDRKLADLRADGVLEDRRLGRLQPVHTAAIARAATLSEWSPSELAHLHVETDGHPLFVIEAARAGPTADHLTPTVQGVIERRLAPLADDRRALLEVAAVLGRRFSPEVLALAADLDEDVVVDAVDELWRLGLVVQVGADFDFGHDKFRDVVIAGVSPARRSRIHRHVAAALVTSSGGDVEAIADRLADHYEHAGMADEAIDALATAAGRATTIGAHAQAVTHLERALRLLADRPEGRERDGRELRLLTDLGASLVVQTGYGSLEAQRTWDRAVALSHRHGTTLSGPVLRGLALAAIAECRFERSVEMGRALCELEDPIAIVEGHYVLGVSRFWQGAFDQAEEHLCRVLADYSPEASPEHRALYGQDPKAVCLCRLGWLRVLQGRAAEGDELLAEAEALADALEHSLTEWYVWTYRGIVDRHLGRPTTRKPPHSSPAGFFAGASEEGQLWEKALGGDADSEVALTAATDRWRQPGHHLHLTMWLSHLAELRLRVGDTETADRLLDEATAFTEAHEQRFLTPELERLRAWALRLQGDPRGGEVAAAAVGRADAMGARGQALRCRAELLRCTWDRTVADLVRTEVDELAQTHHGKDLDEARGALAELVTDVM